VVTFRFLLLTEEILNNYHEMSVAMRGNAAKGDALSEIVER